MRKQRISITRWVGAICSFILYNVLFVVVYITDLIKTQVLSYAFTFLLHAVGAVMAFSVLGLIAKGIKWKESKVFMAFSDNSMVIYLFHQQIIYFTITWLNGVVSPEINTLVNFVVSLFLSILIGFVLRRFKVTRILVGEK